MQYKTSLLALLCAIGRDIDQAGKCFQSLPGWRHLKHMAAFGSNYSGIHVSELLV